MGSGAAIAIAITGRSTLPLRSNGIVASRHRSDQCPSRGLANGIAIGFGKLLGGSAITTGGMRT